MITAPDILRAGLAVLEQRGQQRDQPGGERSMPAVVDAFHALTGIAMTDQQGWLFMALVKIKRSQTGRPDVDHYVDGANYFALAGEAALLPEPTGPIPPSIRAARAARADCELEHAADCPHCGGTGVEPGAGGTWYIDCSVCRPVAGVAA